MSMHTEKVNLEVDPVESKTVNETGPRHTKKLSDKANTSNQSSS